MNQNKNLEALDILAILSFIIQLQNQNYIIDFHDVQHEVDKAIDVLNAHLEKQDEKINKIMEALNIENNKETQ